MSRVWRGWLPRLAGVPAAHLAQLLLRWTRRRAGVALVYHRVEESAGVAEHHLAACHGLRLFKAQLQHVSSCYRVVPAGDLARAVRERRRGQRFPVAITFDDDLRSHVEVASPILRARDVRGTFFLCGASLKQPFSFWWERLQAAFEAGVPMGRFVPGVEERRRGGEVRDRRALHSTAAAIESMAPPDRDRVAALLEREIPEPPSWAGLGADDVRALSRGRHEIGFHTRRHDSLPPLERGPLRDALQEGKRELAEAACAPVASIAYPHGKADEHVAAAAKDAGYAAGFTTSGAAVTPRTDPHLLGRLEPSFISRGHLALQIARALVRASD